VNAATRFQAGDFATPANILTLSRILLAPPLFAIILNAEDTRGASWAAFSLGLFLAVSDNLDGKLARRHGTTRSGAFLDPLADKIVVLGVMFCLVAVDRYWWLPVVLVTARELAVSAWRTYWARRGLAIPRGARRSTRRWCREPAQPAVMPPLGTLGKCRRQIAGVHAIRGAVRHRR
jgi:CDP-diacylglycerol--glycerol-3-phosphate 3-phosphatidyltransferase